MVNIHLLSSFIPKNKKKFEADKQNDVVQKII